MDRYPDSSILDHFHISEETYKVVAGHEIKTALLTPRHLAPGVHPVIIVFHGGFLVYGHALYAPFMAPWLLKIALEQGALVVSPDHRLLPSANGVADVLEDLEDFWQWRRSTLPSVLAARSAADGTYKHTYDLSRPLVMGGSAGGYCAAQIALSHPDDISVLALTYPIVDPADRLLVDGPRKGEPTILRVPHKEVLAKEVARAWIAKARKTVASRAELERAPFTISATQNGLYFSDIFLNRGTAMQTAFSPMERVKAGHRLPKNVWILHGDADTVVNIQASREFVNLTRMNLPDTTIRIDIGRNEDHAFDLTRTSWELDAIGALDWVKKCWLGA